MTYVLLRSWRDTIGSLAQRKCIVEDIVGKQPSEIQERKLQEKTTSQHMEVGLPVSRNVKK
jgi:hypothetical protein